MLQFIHCRREIVMKRTITTIVALSMFAAANFFLPGCAEVTNATLARKIRLDPIFTSHMVLQRDLPIRVRGWANAGDMVRVSLKNRSATAVAGPNGEWIALLPALKAGGPYSLVVEGETKIILDDVMVGDVWICSGQSNMAMSVSRVMNAKQEIASASHPQIRLFTVSRKFSARPLDTLAGSSGWKVCSPESVPGFSAAGYFFGRELNSTLRIPIGLISTSWGGTVAEAWTSLTMLHTLPSMKARIARTQREKSRKMKERIARYKALMRARQQELDKLLKLESDSAYQRRMANPVLDDGHWQVMQLPTPWEKAGLPEYDGAVWFRKTIRIPRELAGKDFMLDLGPIDEVDITYFNGHKVGGKGSMKKGIAKYWNQPRHYRVPGHLVKPGANTIAVMAMDILGEGGLWGAAPETMKAYPVGREGNSIPLSGAWKFKAEPALHLPPRPRNPEQLQNCPAFLFNAMIHPLLHFPITGAIWYQGESNASRAYQYRRLFPAMIQDWRIRWNQGDFPFYFVQLANFKPRKRLPADSAWAELREAQTMALRLPNTGMAVIIDIGMADDIHPKNKQDVGRRLAYNALAQHYGKKTVPCGPLYRSMVVNKDRVVLSFDCIGRGLRIRGGGELKGFAIAGKDRKFVWAKAKLQNNKVVVWSDKVSLPVAVRYAWADNPECNLYNNEDLPASPFRTDDWPGVTLGRY